MCSIFYGKNFRSAYLCGMGRILGIDYGTKRVGLAVTDPLQIIVSGLETVSNQEAIEYVLNYCKSEQVDKIVRIAREHGMEPASPDEAREILSLKGLENVKF